MLAENDGGNFGSFLFQIRKPQIIKRIIAPNETQIQVGRTDVGEIRKSKIANSRLIAAAINPSYVLKKLIN